MPTEADVQKIKSDIQFVEAFGRFLAAKLQ